MSDFRFSNLITIKNDDWLKRQRIAGKCVAGILRSFKELMKAAPPNLSLLDIQAMAEEQLIQNDCLATFRDYKGFPGAVCLSVNKQLVHGIPVNYILQPGDVVSLDLGATYNGAIADAAVTAIYGEPKLNQHVELIKATKECLDKAIAAIAVGKQLGVIGYAIHKHASAKGFGLVCDYGGHGLDEGQPHAPPFVANKAQPKEGVRFVPGMTLAIEPMLVIGNPQTKKLADGWTIVTTDIGAHFEHSIFIHENEVEILTKSEE